MKVDSSVSGMKIVGAAILLSLMLFTLGLAVSYVRDEFWHPAGNTYSVPAPRGY